MKRLMCGVAVLLTVIAVGWVVRADDPLPIPKANVLPLSLRDEFQFRKFSIFRNVPPRPGATPIITRDLMIDFERRRRLWGAVTYADQQLRTGQYFTFFWRAQRAADLTLRLEYRQANLRNYVQARELYYPRARGSYTSEFAVVGPEYSQDGPITMWRAVLIENQQIVALLQSRTWQ